LGLSKQDWSFHDEPMLVIDFIHVPQLHSYQNGFIGMVVHRKEDECS
jgi:hypothetical protein